MTKKQLILYGARYAVLKMLEKGNCMLVVKSEDGTHQSIEYEDICNYLTEEIEKCKAEIQNAGGFIGYNTYSEAFDMVDNMPPVTPTHGTCKNCKNCDTYEESPYFCKKQKTWINRDNFGCTDFEKRGSKNV